jgi:hypothetical protein
MALWHERGFLLIAVWARAVGDTSSYLCTEEFFPGKT